MWTTAEKVLSVAASQRGCGNIYAAEDLPWGGAYVNFCFKQAGCSSYTPGQPNYVPSIDNWCRSFCKEVPAKFAKRGDIVIISFDGGITKNQVGICRGKDQNYIYTWEGNTSLGKQRVAPLQREYSICTCFRPPYKPLHNIGDVWNENGKVYSKDVKGTYYEKTVDVDVYYNYDKYTNELFPENIINEETTNIEDIIRWKKFLNWALDCDLDIEDTTFDEETQNRTAEFQEMVNFVFPNGSMVEDYTLAMAKLFTKKYSEKGTKKVYI